MPLIDTTEIANGMILARDITNLEGRVLLREGLTLSARHVTALKAWGIERIRVRDTDSAEGGEPGGSEASSARIAEIDEELTDIFRHADMSHPVIACLFDEAKSRRLGGAR